MLWHFLIYTQSYGDECRNHILTQNTTTQKRLFSPFHEAFKRKLSSTTHNVALLVIVALFNSTQLTDCHLVQLDGGTHTHRHTQCMKILSDQNRKKGELQHFGHKCCRIYICQVFLSWIQLWQPLIKDRQADTVHWTLIH